MALLDVKKLANERLQDVILQELERSKTRVTELEKKYPSAQPRELAQRCIDDKKNLGSMIGGISGIFGIFSVPADLLVMAWLQLVLLVDVATVYKVNLQVERSRQELLDLFGYANGIGPVQRTGPKVLGSVAGMLLARGGFKTFGRVVPLVAGPITAYLNNRHIQEVGEEALRHYQGFEKAHSKRKSA